MDKTYIRFFYPGSFVSDTDDRPVASRQHPVDVPARAYAYQFFTQGELEHNGEILRGSPKDFSPTHYVGGDKLSLEQVKALNDTGQDRILISNMECNRWDYVVRTRFGQFMPFKDGDTIVEAP